MECHAGVCKESSRLLIVTITGALIAFGVSWNFHLPTIKRAEVRHAHAAMACLPTGEHMVPMGTPVDTHIAGGSFGVEPAFEAGRAREYERRGCLYPEIPVASLMVPVVPMGVAIAANDNLPS